MGLTYLTHATINYLIVPIHEAALVASKPEHSMGLLDGFTEAAGGEVDLATVTFSSVIAEPVLQERRAGRFISPRSNV